MVLGVIGRIAHSHPIKFGCVFSCAKTSFSDWLVQTQVEKRERIDWKRNLTFASFGFFYLGGVQYFLYVPVFSRLFPGAAAFAKAPLAAKLKDTVGQRNMVVQVVIDQFVHHPFLYFPVFYGLKEVVNGGTVGGGLAKYQKNYKEDLPALWKLWVPSTIINFSIMPMHLRIPWVASTSLIWTCIISYMRGSDDAEMDSDQAMAMQGNQGVALQALYDLGVAAKPAYLYDKSKAHLMVTATGRDRIGFIGQVASNVAQHKGNVLDVKAYKVGREFVTIMLLECEPSETRAIEKGLLGIPGVQAAVQHTQPWLSDADSPRCKDGVTFTGHLRATGLDRPGLLVSLTELLSAQGLDITSLECRQHLQQLTRLRSTKSGGADETVADASTKQQLFQIDGVVRAFSSIDRVALEAKLAHFEKENGIRLGIQETQPDPSFSAFTADRIVRRSSMSSKLVKTITGVPPPAPSSGSR